MPLVTSDLGLNDLSRQYLYLGFVCIMIRAYRVFRKFSALIILLISCSVSEILCI